MEHTIRTERLVRDIRDYSPRRGEAAFWWLGQLGYIVKTRTATFSFDAYITPHKSRNIKPQLRSEDMTFVDFVFGSHDHSDHIDRAAWPGIAAAAPGARFVVPQSRLPELAAELPIARERFIGLDEGERFDYTDAGFDGLKITAVAAAHEFLAKDPATGLHDALGYIVDADGLRIYHSGDTCKYEGLETKLLARRPIDLMFLPINGRDAARYASNCIGNMSFAEAVDLAGTVAPALAVPGHYDMFPNNSEDPAKFTEYIAVKYPAQRFWVGGHGVRVIYH